MVSKRQQKKATAKAQKRSLSQHVRRIPQELREEIDQITTDLVQEAQSPTTTPVSSPASVSPAEVKVTIKVEPEQLKQDKKQSDIELKVDKDLLKSIKELTGQFDFNRKKEEKGVKGFIQNKVASVKNAFSLEGAAGMMGVRRDDGSLKGAILGSMLKKSDEQKEKAKFISNFGMFTEAGRSITGGKTKLSKEETKELAKEGSKRFEALSKIKERKEILEQKSAAARSFGSDLTEEDQKTLKKLNYAEKFTSGLMEKKKPVEVIPEQKQQTPAEQRKDLLTGTAEGMREGIQNASPEERQAMMDMDPELLKGIFRGALEELVSISDDQLQMLEKMAGSLPTEEDRMEAKKRESSEPIKERAAQKVASKDGSLIGNIVDALKGKFPMLANVGKTVFSAGKTIASGASKALPGIATGAMKGIGAAAKGVLGKLGPLAMAGMAAYDGVTGFQNAGDNLGIEGREATTGEKFSSAAGGIASGLTFGLLDRKTASKGVANFFGAGPTAAKTDSPTRVIQSSELALKREALRQTELAAGKEIKQAPAIINNAPTSIVNNKTTNVQRIPVRNTEPTFNNRLRTHFA